MIGVNEMISKPVNIRSVVIIGVMASLVFLGTYCLRINISIFGTQTMIHLGNAFCLLVSILFGGVVGGLAGGIGMALFDVISGQFVVYAPFTFVLKFMMGLVCGIIIAKNKNIMDYNKLKIIAILISVLINLIFSPIISLVIKVFIYGIELKIATVMIMGSIISTGLTSVITFIMVIFLSRLLENKLKIVGIK